MRKVIASVLLFIFLSLNAGTADKIVSMSSSGQAAVRLKNVKKRGVVFDLYVLEKKNVKTGFAAYVKFTSVTSKVKMIVLFDKKMNFKRLKLLTNSKYILKIKRNKKFMKQEVDSVTGATETSHDIVKVIEQASKLLKKECCS